MDWRGRKFEYVRVFHGRTESVEPLSKVMQYGPSGRIRGNRTIWAQPMSDDGALMPAYYGPVVFRFAGWRPKKKREAFQFQAKLIQSVIKPAKKLIGRLMENNIGYGDIDVFFAMPDVYVEVSPTVFGLQAGSLFPRECHRVALEWGQDLGCDMSIYHGLATIPIYGSKIRLPFIDDSYLATYVRPRRFAETDGSRLILEGKQLGPPHTMRRTAGEASSTYRINKRPIRENINGQLPPALLRALNGNIETARLEQLCFATGLAIKDIGGNEEDALALVNTISDIHTLDKRQIVKTIRRALLSRLHFGYRMFAKHFPEFTTDISEVKSPFIIFERRWIERLLDAKTEYFAHTVLYQLLADYHAHPDDWKPLPVVYPTGRRQANAVRSLVSHCIMSIRKRGEGKQYHLNINHDELVHNYIRMPVHYLTATLDAKEGVLLLSQILVSSTGRATYRMLHMKRKSIQANLDISSRTLENYARLLRQAGVSLSPKFIIHF
jgi:hypothetical protein